MQEIPGVNKEPIKRVKGLPRDEQCLKYPVFQCDCCMSDKDLRKKELKSLRHELGAYSLENLFDPGVAENCEQRRKDLCEGAPPTFKDQVIQKVTSFKIRIV